MSLWQTSISDRCQALPTTNLFGTRTWMPALDGQ